MAIPIQINIGTFLHPTVALIALNSLKRCGVSHTAPRSHGSRKRLQDSMRPFVFGSKRLISKAATRNKGFIADSDEACELNEPAPSEQQKESCGKPPV